MTDSWGQPAPQQQGWGAPQGPPPPAQLSAPTQTIDDFFESSSGGNGAPSFKFQNIVGHGVLGIITDQRVAWKTKPGRPGEAPVVHTDKAGNPMTQVEVTLQTNLRNWQDVSKIPTVVNDQGQQIQLPANQDTGLRRVYLWYTLRDAVVRAVQAAGQKRTDVGWELGVKVEGVEQNPQGGSPIRKYVAIYRRPTGAVQAAPVVAPPQQAAPPPPPQQQQWPTQAPPPQQMPPSSPWGQAPPQQQMPPPPNPGYPDEPPFG